MVRWFISATLLLTCPVLPSVAFDLGPEHQGAVVSPRPEAILHQSTAPLTEEEVYDLVWNLPDVQREINNVLAQGGVPSASIGFRPQTKEDLETQRLFYTVHFEAGRVDRPMLLPVFVVDALTREILVYDSSSGKLTTLDEWRERGKRTGHAR